jgi:hypothetical protein
VVPLIGAEPIDDQQAINNAGAGDMGPSLPEVGLEATNQLLGGGWVLQGARSAVTEVDLENMQKRIVQIRDGLDGLFVPAPGKTLKVSSVTIELGLTATGDVGFIVANGSLEAAAKISVTLGPG